MLTAYSLTCAAEGGCVTSSRVGIYLSTYRLGREAGTLGKDYDLELSLKPESSVSAMGRSGTEVRRRRFCRGIATLKILVRIAP